MPIKKSLYECTEHSRDQILNKGFDYHGQIFKKTMSSFLFKDETRSAILSYIEEVFYEMIEQVKTIKTFYHYARKKNDRNFN